VRIFLYESGNKKIPGNIVTQLLGRYALDFFICVGYIGFVVFNDSLNINPMLKIQNKNKSFIAIFKQVIKKDRVEKPSFSIKHDEYNTHGSNFIGCYYEESGVLYLDKSYRGELTKDQAREIYECYLSYL
jgi:hypothetical protein